MRKLKGLFRSKKPRSRSPLPAPSSPNPEPSSAEPVTSQTRDEIADGETNTSRGSNRRERALRSAQRGSNQYGDASFWNGQNFQGNFYGDLTFNPPPIPSSEIVDQKLAKQWMVPRSASSFYTGRQELDRRLAQAFSSTSPNLNKQKRFVINGLGGTGKSEVCLKFAEDHQDGYWGIFWLNATSTVTAEQGYTEIGQRCGVVEPALKNVKSWLAFTERKWLLIVDNADNPDIDYSQYMPSGKKGDILISTRNSECVSQYSTVGSETLDNLSPEHARQLLFQTAGIKEQEWQNRNDEAMSIVRLLGSHTLAIIQAGAFIQKGLCPMRDYSKFFQERRKQVLQYHSQQNVSNYQNVYATFEVSAEYLQKSNPENINALELVHILAFMHNIGIEENTFQRAAKYAAELTDEGPSNDTVVSFSLNHIARLPEFIPRGWTSPQILRFRQAFSTLESLSLITRQTGESAKFSLHPLVHAWAKERQDHQNQCKSWQAAATILVLSCQGSWNYIPEFAIIQPHVQACVNHEINDYTQNMIDVEVAQIYIKFINMFDELNDHNMLHFLVQKHMRSRLENILNPDQDPELKIQTCIGLDFELQGNFKIALDIYTKIDNHLAQTVSNDHPDRLDSKQRLAGIYLENGQIDKAVNLLEHVVEIRKMSLNENDAERLTSEHALASAYLANEQIDKAVILLEHVVKIEKKSLAENHPSRLTSQHALADAYLTDGKIDKAVILLEHVVKIQKKSMAENHPSRLTSQHALARAYEAQGRIDEAISLLEYVVSIEKESLAANHRNRIVSQGNLAIYYREKGQIEKARELERLIEESQAKDKRQSDDERNAVDES